MKMNYLFWVSLSFFLCPFSIQAQSDALLKQLQSDFGGFPILFHKDSILKVLEKDSSTQSWEFDDSLSFGELCAINKISGQRISLGRDHSINISRRYYSDGKTLRTYKTVYCKRCARQQFRKFSRKYRKHFEKIIYKKRTTIAPGGYGFYTERLFFLSKKDKVPYMSISWSPGVCMAPAGFDINIHTDIDLSWKKKKERKPKF